jgi:hypothetical protein
MMKQRVLLRKPCKGFTSSQDSSGPLKESLSSLFLIGILSVMMGWSGSFASAGIVLSTGARYDNFQEDNSDGAEMTIPLGIAYEGDQLFLRLETAYSQTNVTYTDAPDGYLSSFTDSRFSCIYLLPDLPVGVRLVLDLNLPSGKAQLSEQERLAQAGERNDLFEVDDFGQGLNVGLNIGLIKEFGPTSLLLSGAYVNNGEYNPSTEIPDETFNPGDQALITTSLNWQASSFILEALGAYSRFSEDTVNGETSFRQGDKWVFGSNFLAIHQPWRMTFGLQYALNDKNEILTEDRLSTESENSNGDEFYGVFDVRYAYSSAFTLRGLANIRVYGESDLKNATGELPIRGQRIRYAAGLGFFHIVNPQFAWSVPANFLIMDRDADVVFNTSTTFQGINLAVGMTYTL